MLTSTSYEHEKSVRTKGSYKNESQTDEVEKAKNDFVFAKYAELIFDFLIINHFFLFQIGNLLEGSIDEEEYAKYFPEEEEAASRYCCRLCDYVSTKRYFLI